MGGVYRARDFVIYIVICAQLVASGINRLSDDLDEVVKLLLAFFSFFVFDIQSPAECSDFDPLILVHIKTWVIVCGTCTLVVLHLCHFWYKDSLAILHKFILCFLLAAWPLGVNLMWKLWPCAANGNLVCRNRGHL